MGANSDTVSCPHHMDLAKSTCVLEANSVEHGKDIGKLFERTDDMAIKMRGLEVLMPEVQKDVSELDKKIDLYSAESDGYRQMVRTTVKDIEHLQVRADKFVKKTDLERDMKNMATLDSINNLRVWIRIWGIATVLAILALVGEIVLTVLIPLLHAKPGP